MTSTATTGTSRATKRRVAATGTVLALVVLFGARLVLDLPLEQIVRAERLGLDPASFQANGGYAVVAPVELEIPTDSDGESELVLLEDGLPLSPHASHQLIRDKGEGRFSHWGKHLYLSSSDGSDPRTNGRSYVAQLPLDRGLLALRARQARTALLVSGALALLACLFWRGKPLAYTARLAVTAALIAWALLSSQGGALEAADGALRALSARLREQGPLPEAGPSVAWAGEAPRTVRLWGDGEPRAFTATGQPLTSREPLAVTMVPGDCVVVRDSLARLGPGCVLVSEGELSVAGDTLAELVLRARVMQGSEVRFTFHTATGSASLSEAQLIVPVQPDGEWHSIRVARPLNRDQVARWLISGKAPITRIELGPAESAAEDLVLELEPLLLSDAMAVYTRSTHGTDTLELGRTLRPATWQSTTGEFSLPWPTAAGTRLRGAVSSLAASPGVDVPYALSVVFADGSREQVAAGSVPTGAPWQLLDIDVSAFATRRPTALAVGTDALPPEAVLAWTSLRLIDTGRPARRVVLLLVDTLRADALACLGHPTNRTPAVDGLGAGGVVFERCYSQAFWTRPSVPSIMSSRYVRGTGVHGAGLYLPDSYETLAEQFAAAGFFSVGFVSNAHAGPAAGLVQGLDEMVLETSIDDTAAFLAAVVEPRLDSLDDEDLFAWIHLMEVHGPYGPVDMPAGFEPAAGTPVTWDERYDRSWNPAPTDASRRALYDADLEHMDLALGRFLDERVARWDAGPGPDTVVALVSDHGEFLGEYGGTWGHEWNRMLPESVHVPFLVRAPGRIAPGTRWSLPVENIDIGPTLLDLSGARPWVPGMERQDQGRSLVPLLAGDDVDHRGDLALSCYATGRGPGSLSVWHRGGGLIGAQGKLIGTLTDTDAVMAEWQPGPPADLSAVGEDVGLSFAQLWGAFDESQDSLRAVMWAAQAGSAEQQLDAESLAQMQALGYLGR